LGEIDQDAPKHERPTEAAVLQALATWVERVPYEFLDFVGRKYSAHGRGFVVVSWPELRDARENPQAVVHLTYATAVTHGDIVAAVDRYDPACQIVVGVFPQAPLSEQSEGLGLLPEPCVVRTLDFSVSTAIAN
jgi:hypothetical protein